MLFQTSLGIDIQDRSFSIAYLTRSFKGIRLAAHAVYPLEREQGVRERVEFIGGLAKGFLKKNRISPTDLFLGIPRDLAVFRYLELPLAVKENLQDSLGYEMEKYVPFSDDEIYFDSQIIEENKETAKMRLALVVVKKESVDPYLALANYLSAGIFNIEISSTGLTNYFSFQPNGGNGEISAFVFLTNNHLEFGIIKKRLLHYSRFIKLETDNHQEIMSKEMKMLRKSLGQDHQGSLDTLLCVPREYVEMISRFSGEGVEVHPVDLSRRGIASLAIMPAFGLALKAFQKVPMDINILPQYLRKKPNKIGYYAMLVLTGMVLLSAFAWGGSSIVRRELMLDSLNREIKQLSSEIVSIDRIRAKCKGLEDQIDYLNAQSGDGANILKILKDLSQRIPESAWISSLTFSDRDVQIEGQAGSASELIPLLEASPMFSNVTFLSTITKGRDGKERFRIGFKVK